LVPRLGALGPDTVSANFIDRIVRSAVNAGASRPRLLSAIHVGDAALRNPIGRLSRPVLVNLFAAIEREFGDRAAGLRLASAARPGTFSDLGFIAMFSANVGDIVGYTVDLQNFRQNIWQTRFDRDTNPGRILWKTPEHIAGQLDACIEFSLASYAHLYKHSHPDGLRPLAAHFQHRPRFDTAIYAELLGCPVHFEAGVTKLEFASAELALPSPLSNAALQQKLLAAYNQPMGWLAENKKHTAFCYIYLASELNKSPLKLERVAASYGLTERTLRRKLVEEGFPFRNLLEKVRRDICDLYVMENRRSISEIAELLGYAELSAFTRAHKRWYGQPPSVARSK
jgi:AraC-like DNA-binding protein